jgi:hypothetical protein
MSKKKKKVTKKKNHQTLNQSNLYGVDENEFLKAVDKISKKLIYKFKFGYHEAEDMRQQAIIFALQGLKNYDKKRPLENFLWTHVRNRLFNYKRDNYQRPDKPCLTCPFFKKNCGLQEHDCEKYNDKNNCSLYTNWLSKNEAKKNIMKPLYIDNDEYLSVSFLDNIKNKEIFDKIDKHISIRHRQIYLNVLHGCKVSKKDYEILIDAIKQILNINDSEDI